MEPHFVNGDAYRVRVEPGSALFESVAKQTLGIKGKLLVTGGVMGGQILPFELYLTEKTKDSVQRQLLILGFDPTKDDWNKIGDLLQGKTAVAIAQEGTGKYAGTFKAGDIRDEKSFIPGGLGQKAAIMFQNINTPPPDPDDFNDRY